MKYIFMFIISIFIFANLSAQEQYSKVRIDLKGVSLEKVSQLGIDISEGYLSKGKFFECDLSSNEVAKLTTAGINYNIIYNDVSKYYAERAAKDKVAKINRNVLDEWVVPDNWEYGSMGGFYTLDEVMSELDDMHTLYPDLISERQPISSTNLTHDGRQQFWVKISDNPNQNETEPEVLYTGVHHAREPMSVQSLIYYMWYLLENYDNDAEIQQLVNNTEMYFVPVINPDGYEYNYQTNPNGGGMWRKNRRDNGGGSFGVDPNRNYGYMWGYDNSGSSPNPDDQTYRGPEAFSEPEIQNVRDFCEAHEFKITLNYHSYSNLLLYTWGWTEDPCDDDLLLHDYAVLMTTENSYVYGPGSTTIYPTNGDSDDWMYGEQTTKEASLTFTPEVGSSSDGFWPSTSRIIPLCQDQMWQNISAARLVGKYAVVNDIGDKVIGNIDGYFTFNIKRLGLTAADSYTVTMEPLDDNIVSVGEPVTFTSLNLMEIVVDSIEYSLNPNIESGTAFQYLISVDNGDYIVSDTVEKVYGELTTIFEDSCDDMENWTSSKWNTVTTDYYSAPASITDSPYGNYQSDEYNLITLDSVINFTESTMAYANFWTKYEIESGYDYVQFLAKDINSGTWVPLTGKYTRPGTEYQQEGEPVYDGNHADWRFEEVDLGNFVGKEVEFKFVLVSDSYVEEDGFYFDNFEINVVSDLTGVNQNVSVVSAYLGDAYPNPSHNSVNIRYNIGSNNNAVIDIFDVLGNIVSSKEIITKTGTISFNMSDFNAGLYFYRLKADGGVILVKRFVKN